MKLLLVLLCAGLTACSSTPSRSKINYVPPSTAPVATSVTGAQERVTSARKRADTQAVNLLAATSKAKSAKEGIIKIEGEAANLPVILGLAKQAGKDLDDLTSLLTGTTTENTGLIQDLESTKSQLNTALVVDIPKLKGQVETQTTKLNTANTNLNKALAQGEIDKANAHKFKAILIGLATAAVVAVLFGLFGMKAFVLPLLWITLGAPAAIGAFLFFWLGSG